MCLKKEKKNLFHYWKSLRLQNNFKISKQVHLKFQTLVYASTSCFYSTRSTCSLQFSKKVAYQKIMEFQGSTCTQGSHSGVSPCKFPYTLQESGATNQLTRRQHEIYSRSLTSLMHHGERASARIIILLFPFFAFILLLPCVTKRPVGRPALHEISGSGIKNYYRRASREIEIRGLE